MGLADQAWIFEGLTSFPFLFVYFDGMKLTSLIAANICAVLLTGCVDTSSPKFQQLAADKCAGFGFAQGTPEFANCRMQLTVEQDRDNTRRKQNMARALNETADNMNESNQRQMDRNAYIAAHQQPVTLYRQPVYCNSRRTFTGNVETVCQ